MNKQRKFRLWLLAVAVGLCSLTAYRLVFYSLDRTVIRLEFGSPDCPVSGLLTAPRPGKGRLDTVLAFDQTDGFYFVASKRDLRYEKQVAHTPNANVINVLVATGNRQQVVPLQRKDGRLVRYMCEFLSVSPSGQRWWTARRPYESRADLQEGASPKAVLTTYDPRGKALQEWTLPTTIGSVGLLQAVGENRAYVLDVDRHQLLIYRTNFQQPQRWDIPHRGSMAEALITPDGKLRTLRYKVDGSVEVTVTVTEPGKSPQLFTRLQGSFADLFWQDLNQGIFLTSPSVNKRDGGQSTARAIYRATSSGELQKLFETTEVLKGKLGQQIRIGRPLKADANSVWMEVEYLKGNKVTEYQIVKVPYR